MDWNHYGTFEHSEAPHVSDELNEEALMFPSDPHIPNQSQVTPCVPSSAHHMEWCRSPAPDPRRFIPPSAGDSRSPCPALNALANHSILCVHLYIAWRSYCPDIYSSGLIMDVISPLFSFSVPFGSTITFPFLWPSC